MLASLVGKLVCPACLTQEHELKRHVFTPGEAGNIRDGVLACPSCGSWYPIEEYLLELVVPSLRNEAEGAQFRVRFESQLADLGLLSGRDSSQAADSNDVSAQLKQQQFFDWYADNSKLDYSAYQNTPFWLAFDQATFGRWKAQIHPGGWLLDIGCANGRSAFRFVNYRDVKVIGFDISKKLIRQAIARAQAAGAAATTTFFVADGSRLPLRDHSFDHVLIYGVLHHLPNPGSACRDVLRILKPGGVYFGSENNKSMFRKVFDLLMKLKPLWTEEAGEEPLISRQMLENWVSGLPVRLRFNTSVFLPPHMFNLFGRRIARFLLPVTDKIFSWVPGLRNHGGLIVFELENLGSSNGSAKRAIGQEAVGVSEG
jgi:ubiquinone/menaquinone biosynthesis C-methylase UbiE/uncharacterized protein YbaR (Trm112 family)